MNWPRNIQGRVLLTRKSKKPWPIFLPKQTSWFSQTKVDGIKVTNIKWSRLPIDFLLFSLYIVTVHVNNNNQSKLSLSIGRL